MKRFPWVSWTIALVMIFFLYFGIAYIVGRLVWGATYDLWECSWAALFACTFTYWLISNKKPKSGGTLFVDTTRDDKDVWRFEVDDISEFESGEYVTIKIVKRKIGLTAKEVEENYGE